MAGKLIDIEQATYDALNITSFNHVIPQIAVGRVLRHQGRDTMQRLLSSLDAGGVAPDIDSIANDLSIEDLVSLRNAGGVVLAGSLCPLLDGAVSKDWDGWRSETMLSFWNETIRGLPMPDLTIDRLVQATGRDEITVRLSLNNKINRGIIRKILDEELGRNEGYFFTNPVTINKIPTVALVNVRFNGYFTKSLVDAGNDYFAVMAACRERTTNA